MPAGTEDQGAVIRKSMKAFAAHRGEKCNLERMRGIGKPDYFCGI